MEGLILHLFHDDILRRGIIIKDPKLALKQLKYLILNLHII